MCFRISRAFPIHPAYCIIHACMTCSLVPSPPPQLSSLAVRITLLTVISDDSCAAVATWPALLHSCSWFSGDFPTEMNRPPTSKVLPEKQWIYLPWPNNCVYIRCGNVLQMFLCGWLLSTRRAKDGHSLLVRRATPEYPTFTWCFLQSGTWRRLPNKAGHGAQSCHRYV